MQHPLPRRPLAAALALMVAVALLLVASPAFAQEAGNPDEAAARKGPLRTAIAPVLATPALLEAMQRKSTGNAIERVTQAMDTQLIDRLHNTQKFEIIARSALADLLREQDLSGSGILDTQESTGTQPFRIKNLDYLTTTRVDHFEDYAETVQFEGGIRGATRRVIQLNVVVMIYDTTTGRLKASANIPIELDERKAMNNFETRSRGDLTDALLLAAAQLAADRAAFRILDILYPAKIIGLTGDNVTINRSDTTGIAVGQVWNVYHLGEDMIDPDTAVNYGPEETQVGQVEITEVTPRFAKARITQNNGVAKLHVLRLADPVAPTLAPADDERRSTRLDG